MGSRFSYQVLNLGFSQHTAQLKKESCSIDNFLKSFVRRILKKLTVACYRNCAFLWIGPIFWHNRYAGVVVVFWAGVLCHLVVEDACFRMRVNFFKAASFFLILRYAISTKKVFSVINNLLLFVEEEVKLVIYSFQLLIWKNKGILSHIVSTTERKLRIQDSERVPQNSQLLFSILLLIPYPGGNHKCLHAKSMDK